MAQGSKYTDEQREKALALLTMKSIKEVSIELNIPEGTIRDWNNNAEKLNPNFKELREEKKKEFVNNAWGVIDDSLAVAKTRMSRARNAENDIDVLVKAIKENAGEIEKHTGITWFRLLDIIKELNSLKSPKLSEISTLIGVLYDKQALANKEATINLGAATSFEEALKSVMGKEM